jgi:cyclophilin family peptidyl-prolyl cis-trans isomerase
LFINYGNNSRLDADRFAPFGEVIEGMEVADQIYAGYGEQPDQTAITNQGKAYLDRGFPRLDRIINAVIEPLPDDSSKDAPAKGAPSKDGAKKDDGKKTKS